jgi:hypothetical protein
MVLTKYPSDKQFDDYDSREKFAEKLYELKYEKFANGQLIAR